MVNPEKKHSSNDRHIDDVDHADQISGGEGSFNDLSSSDGTSTSENPSITGRLMEILVEDGDGDLLLQRSHWDGEVLQWLRALDLQVMGACRADERLKPMLKLNISPGAAEDHLLAHISQHFEPSEIGILAMCLCVPLVSIRVGKVNKQGTCLYPTSIRGHLNLTLLPTSNLRISFNGDDGCMERLATSSPGAQCPGVEIEEISADKSGRSFLVKNPVGEISYFWCSEKSKLLGSELIRKMKNLLTEKPSLAELTGISESRLNCFVIHLRAYLAGSVMNSAQASHVLSDTLSLDNSVDSSRLSFTSQKTSRFRHNGSQGSKTNLQGSLSPRSSSFTGLPRSLSLLRSKEKESSPGESYISGVDSLNVASPNCADPPSLNCFERNRLSEATGADVFPQLSFLDVLEKSTDLYLSGPEARVPSSSSCFSPHYCWCPPVASTLQYPTGTPQLPISIIESVSLPPLSSFLSTTRSLKPSEPPVDFPPLLAEPLVRLPLTRPTSQQIPTFTPLICDPIVHIPVINVCSSGQGYLVTAGPAISTVISPFIPSLVEPLIPDAESVVEKGARETLRMLINSSNEPNPQLLDVLPSVLTRSKDKNVVSLGSRGLYIGTRDVGAISISMTTQGLASVSEKSMGGSVGKRYIRRDDLGYQNEKTSGSGLSNPDDRCSNLRDSGTH
ncbi:unnamed protein product [Fraxinus pennsylvanica]|uniref:Flocculation protein n=1 Tax=Fraxinus pennsylvanica TaxID=56036 RepID=A0AAD1ZTK4_9LAMI|nr:unnamed protein product [Fraxinus pennsylvanica]